MPAMAQPNAPYCRAQKTKTHHCTVDQLCTWGLHVAMISYTLVTFSIYIKAIIEYIYMDLTDKGIVFLNPLSLHQQHAC